MVIDKIQVIEALLFASDTPLNSRKIKDIIPDVSGEKEIKKLIQQIDEKYEETSSPLKIIEVAGGYQIVTREQFDTWIKQLYKSRQASRLTRKGLETLAIIAYKQPITKQEIEFIRGVNVDGIVRALIERNLITVKGREKAPGSPLLYGTTDYFLEYFGLKNIDDLPKLKEIDELLKGDEKFLESLDQVALKELHPEALGMSFSDPSEEETENDNSDNPEENKNDAS